jgi:hypothetical protein
LIVLFDGTWSAARTRTNVERFRRLIAPIDDRGVTQLCSYVAGVGVKPGIEHWLGGAFGLGLSANVKDGYRWLSETWCAGDEIWLFGFSRGAYTARSLVGLIRKCGLLWPDAAGRVGPIGVDHAYALYRNALHPDDRRMRRYRDRFARAAGVHFVGVWETVGMLGIPGVAAWFPFARAMRSTTPSSAGSCAMPTRRSRSTSTAPRSSRPSGCRAPATPGVAPGSPDRWKSSSAGSWVRTMTSVAARWRMARAIDPIRCPS